MLVVDRDRESFVAHEENNQYKYVLENAGKMVLDYI